MSNYSLVVEDVLSKYNKGVMFEYDNEQERTFLKLSELFNQSQQKTHTLHALFINTKSQYGDEPVAVIEGHYINLPRHLLDTVKEMREDDDFVYLVNQRKVGMEIYQYQSKHGLAYSVNWVEV